MSSLSGAHGLCDHRPNNRALLSYISLHVLEQMGGQSVRSLFSGQLILKNGSDFFFFFGVQLPSLSLFSNTFVISSFLYGFFSIFAFHPLCRPNLFELLCLFLLLFNYKSLDMSHLWQYWVWSIWPSPCTCSLPKHDTFICFRTRDSACMGLCRRWICSSPDPKQSRRQIGRTSQCSIVYGSDADEGRWSWAQSSRCSKRRKDGSDRD